MKKSAKVLDVPLYKVLVDGESVHGGTFQWSLPTADGPGDWHEVEGEVKLCSVGFHLTPDPSRWWVYNAECYLVEAEGVAGDVDRDSKVVAKRVRLMRRLTWSELEAFGIYPDGVNRDSKPQLAMAKKKLPPVPPPPKQGPSPAMRLVSTVWENRCGSTEHSWRRVNQAMHEALSLAISGGLSFAVDDFAEIYRSMRGGYWMGDPEGFFAHAVEEGHRQACASFEAWTKRPPFIWEGKRLAIRASFQWAGVVVHVTSFTTKGDVPAIVACSYKPRASRHDYSPGIEKRFTITVDDLKRAERDRKVELALAAEAKEVQKALGHCRIFAEVETIIGWTPEQRSEAREWALLAKHDAHKERVKPAAAPAHVAAAALKDERAKVVEEADDKARHRAYHVDEIARHTKDLAEIDALAEQANKIRAEDAAPKPAAPAKKHSRSTAARAS